MPIPIASSSAASTPFYADRRQGNVEDTRCKKCRRFLWNREKHTCLNRTGESWFKFIFYYSIFLGILLGVFFLLLMNTLNYIHWSDSFPLHLRRSFLDKSHPAVGFFPFTADISAPLIWYTLSGEQDKHNMREFYYSGLIDDFLKKYEEAEANKHLYSDCTVENDPKKPCLFKKQELGPCGQPDYGYKDNKPCFYLKVNKVPEWTVEYYDENLPKTMPRSLEKIIKKSDDKEMLWINCVGDYPHDKEHAGEFTYYPSQGFKGYYFPYTGDNNYLSPLVAVQMNNLKQGFVVNIHCSAWAKNINTEDYHAHSVKIQFYLAL